VEGCVSALADLGYVFSRREDGSVAVKQPAQRNPRAAEMMAYLALHKEEVRAVVRDREEVQMQLTMKPEPDAGGWIVLEGVTPEVAFAAGELIKQGKAELIGRVIYRRRSNVFDLTYKMLEVGK
jgi:hypothetical protein